MYREYRRRVKMRRVTQGNPTGDSYGITMPPPVGEKFLGTYFTVAESGTTIILSSGTRYA